MDFTFKGIKEDLVSKLKEYSKWSTEILTLGVYSVLLDIMAFIIEKFAYYVDFRFIETTSNATLRSSVVRIAKDHGYIPTRKSGAIGYIIIGDDEGFSSTSKVYTGQTVNIPRWKQFQSKDGQSIVYSIEEARLVGGSIQKTMNPTPGSATLNIESGSETGITITAHGLVSGDIVYISGTRNIDGAWTLTDNTTANRISIPRSYTAETFTGLETIRAGYCFVKVREGNPQEFTYIAEGNINEKISLFSDSIDQNELQVFRINSNNDIIEEVQIVEDLYFVDDTSIYTCEVENFDDYSGIWIKFGDDITSKKLKQDDRFLIKYSLTKGSTGNIRNIDIINEPITPFLNVYNVVENLFVTNIEPVIGGTDLESLLQIKKQYSRLYSSTKQLTKRDAWIAAVESKQYVYRAIVWTELDIGKGKMTLTGTGNQNVHYISAVNTEGNRLIPSQESDISNTVLVKQKSPTDSVSWQKLAKVRIKLDTLAEINNTISFADMKTRMVDACKNDLGVLNLEFKQEIYLSNIWSTIGGVADVIRHETDAFYAEEDIDQSATLKDFIVTQTSVTLKPEEKIITVNNTPEIWIRRKINDKWYEPLQISHTVGNAMSGMNLFNVSGTVVYTGTKSSQITYQCFDLLSDIVPSISGIGITDNNSQIVSMVDVSNAEPGMFVSGLNIVTGSQISSVDYLNNTMVLNTPSNSTGADTGEILLSWFPNMTSSFGARNPDDGISTGYIVYLIYQTMDGFGNRVGDMRLAKFNQILDFSEELSVFNYMYP